MNPRDIVLGAIRKNLHPVVPLPEVQSFAHPGEPLLQARGEDRQAGPHYRIFAFR